MANKMKPILNVFTSFTCNHLTLKNISLVDRQRAVNVLLHSVDVLLHYVNVFLHYEDALLHYVDVLLHSVDVLLHSVDVVLHSVGVLLNVLLTSADHYVV